MVDMNARKKLYDLIKLYYEGQINNYDLDDGCFSNFEPLALDKRCLSAENTSSDPLVIEIASQLWYYYDDVRLHLWFDSVSYDSNIQRLVSVWLYFLLTDIQWEDIKGGPFGKNYSPLPWPFASEDDVSKFIGRFGKDSYPYQAYYPPVNALLITKQLEIFRFYIFKKNLIKHTYNKLAEIINFRDEFHCRLKWKCLGYDSQLVANIIESLFSFQNSSNHLVTTEKILPCDSIIFALSGSDLVSLGVIP